MVATTELTREQQRAADFDALRKTAETKKQTQVVIQLELGRVVKIEDFESLPGFEPHFVITREKSATGWLELTKENIACLEGDSRIAAIFPSYPS